MDLTARIVLVVAALGVAGAAWALVRRGRGRVRPAAGAGSSAADLPAAWSTRTGNRLTLVQISSEHCSTCAQSLRVWRAAIDDGGDGVELVHVDAADHLDLVAELGVRTVPTTLLYDGDGVLVGRVVGAPTTTTAADAVRQGDGVLA